MPYKTLYLLSCALIASSLPVHATDDRLIVQDAPFIKELPITSQKSSFEPFTGVVIAAKVRMRTQPILDSHVVRETAQGEMFAVMNETNEYYSVAPPKGTKGYVFRTFVLNDTVEGERVNVRLYPDIDAPVVAQLNTGDHISSTVSETNPKWLVIDLPSTARFFIAKEYIEKKGGIDLIATIEKRKSEAAHHLSAIALFAQSEIQKPFEQIDLDKIQLKFNQMSKDYGDIPAIKNQVQEALVVFQDIYVQKKISFLEGKAERKTVNNEIDPRQIDRLANLGIELKPLANTADVANSVVGQTSPANEELMTDKMMAWQALEQSLYHVWAASNTEKTIQEFYSEEELNASILTGIVEPYTRPVKNRPGDFLLRSENLPVAFLYSTHVNLEKHVGKKVTLIAAPRPNHNFAFPAYFVINVE
jgi:uncharacterized protein YgiM (DUF1202 family)